MKLIYNKIFLNHDTGSHPENKNRLSYFENEGETEITGGEPYLNLVHTDAHIKKIKEACKSGISLDPDTLTSKGSYEAAVDAVGATIMASESNDFALVRPPGHHSYPSRASGFCLFNNIAIATRKLVNEGKRVLIFDFDGHFGNGTSNIFYDSDKVLYWSIHQYPAYPGTGSFNKIGRENGRGFNINVPLPPGSGDDIFMDAVERFLPVAEQFNPDVVGVSAGFDAHLSDFLLQLRITLGSYYKIGKLLGKKFKNVFATLEGGYNIEFLPLCINNFMAGINGKKQPHKEPETESGIMLWDEYERRIFNLIDILKNYWVFSEKL